MLDFLLFPNYLAKLDLQTVTIFSWGMVVTLTGQLQCCIVWCHSWKSRGAPDTECRSDAGRVLQRCTPDIPYDVNLRLPYLRADNNKLITQPGKEEIKVFIKAGKY